VEIYHTSTNGEYARGFKKPCGTIDFYFNKMKTQPACQEKEEVTNKKRRTDENRSENNKMMGQENKEKEKAGCSHRMAFQYFMAVLRNEECFIGYKTSFKGTDLIEEDGLGNEKVVVGLNLNNPKGVYVVTPKMDFPYCNE